MITFGVPASQLAGLKYRDMPAWDSVGHMALIAELETAFGVLFAPEDIIDFSSYEKGQEILKIKYGIDF